MLTTCLGQDSEFTHRFFKWFTCFCERKINWLSKMSESLLSLFCHERPEQIAHCCSFVKSDRSESLKSLFKKCEWEKSDGRDFLLGIKKGKTVKNLWKIRIFQAIDSFLQAICSNHSYNFFKEQISHSHSLKWAILSERAKSHFAKERIPNTAYMLIIIS